ADSLHSACARRNIQFSEIDEGVRLPQARTGVLQFQPYTARGKKAERAKVASILVEQGRVSFVPGLLQDLEERLLAFDGREGAVDDAVDAWVASINALGDTAGTGANGYRPGDMQIIAAMNRQLTNPHYGKDPVRFAHSLESLGLGGSRRDSL